MRAAVAAFPPISKRQAHHAGFINRQFRHRITIGYTYDKHSVYLPVPQGNVWTIFSSLSMHRARGALCQVRPMLRDGPAMASPTFPQCAHRFGAVFAQVIHMLSTASLAAILSLSDRIRPAAVSPPGSAPVLGVPFVPMLPGLGGAGEYPHVIEVRRRRHRLLARALRFGQAFPGVAAILSLQLRKTVASAVDPAGTAGSRTETERRQYRQR
jgi:hypothetical protein